MTPVASRRVWALVAIAALLYGLALVVTPHAPPIYDGIGFPDEPYRFVDPPPGYRDTKPATTATSRVPVTDGHSTGGQTINSAESGPQVSVYLPSGAVLTDAGVSSVTVTAAPVPLAGDPPPGHVWGNVYRLTFATSAGAGRLAPGAEGEIALRSPSLQQPGPTFYVRHAGGQWSPLRTGQPGRDIYQTDLAGVGEYVLAGDEPLDVKAKDPNSEAAVGWFGLGVSGAAVVLVIVLFVRAERRRSRRRAH